MTWPIDHRPRRAEVYADSAAGPRQLPRAADTPDVLERIGDPTKHEDQ
jgi:hypothetical protein